MTILSSWGQQLLVILLVLLATASRKTLPLFAGAADLVITNDLARYNALADSQHGFPHQTFRSSPVIAPVFHVNYWNKTATARGPPYLFLGANYRKVRSGGGRGGAGPLILDARDLSLVYADQSYTNGYYCEVATVAGEPHLTFAVHDAEGRSIGVVLDQSYRAKYDAHGHLAAVAPHENDMHDLHVTDEGTVVFVTKRRLVLDEFDCGRWAGEGRGKRGRGVEKGEGGCHILDTGFQEVDMETREVLFGWWASDHFDPEDSVAVGFTQDQQSGGGNDDEEEEEDDYDFSTKEGDLDLSHMNAVRKLADGNYLVSSRHFCTVQLISGETGQPLWTLGGRRNQFRDLSGGRATDIGWQHHPRFLNYEEYLLQNGTLPIQLTLFDNHGPAQGDCIDINDDDNDDDNWHEDLPPCQSRGLHLELDTTDPSNMTARVVRQYRHPGRLNAGAMGGMQKLGGDDASGHSALVSWGWTPSYVEYGEDGDVVMDMQRGKVGGGRQGDMFAYRAYKGEWTGRPGWRPSFVVDVDGDGEEEVEEEEDDDETTKGMKKATVYMSWNGATDIRSWAVFSSSSSEEADLVLHAGVDIENNRLVVEVPRTGFETTASFPADRLARYVAVAAVDGDGNVLGVSDVLDRGPRPGEEEEEEENVTGEGITEEDEYEEEYDTESEDGEHVDSFVGAVIGVILLISAAISCGVYYYWRKKKTAAPVEAKYVPLRDQGEA